MVALSALSIGAARVARAAPKAVILPTTWRNVAGETERITLVGSIAATVAAQGYDLIEDRLRDATLEGDKRLAECIEKIPCKLELAERLNADVAVSSTVQRAPGQRGRAEWLVTIALLPIDVRRLGSTDLRRCGACTVAEVEPMITSLIGEVFAAERKRARAKLVVRAHGVQATVLLDGEPCAANESERVIYAGTHVVRVEGGGRVCERRIDASAGTVIELEADFERRLLLPAGERGRGGSAGGRGAPRWVRPLGVVALVAGLAAAAAGIGLLAIDGRGTCDLVPPAEHCPERYATFGSGLGLTVVGGAFAVAGAVMALLPRAPERVAVLPLLGPGAAGLALEGRY